MCFQGFKGIERPKIGTISGLSEQFEAMEEWLKKFKFTLNTYVLYLEYSTVPCRSISAAQTSCLNHNLRCIYLK